MSLIYCVKDIMAPKSYQPQLEESNVWVSSRKWYSLRRQCVIRDHFRARLRNFGAKHVVKNWEEIVKELVEAFLVLNRRECRYIYWRTLRMFVRDNYSLHHLFYPGLKTDEELLSECGFLVHPPEDNSLPLTAYTKDPTFLAELEQVVDYLLFYHGSIQVSDVRHPVDPNTTISTFLKIFFVEQNLQLPRIGIASHHRDKIEMLMGDDIKDAECVKCMILESLRHRQSHNLYQSTVTKGAERHSWFYSMILRGGDAWLFNPDTATGGEWMKVLSALAYTSTEHDYGLDARFAFISNNIDFLLK